jgi:hypothetical protein
VRPGEHWYWVAGAVGAASIVAAGAIYLTQVILPMLSSLTSLHAPGEVTVDLEAGDERTIYQQTRDSGASLRLPASTEIACAVTKSDGDRIELSDSAMSLDKGDAGYSALFDFEAPESGAYRVRCQDPTQPGRRIPLAIGEKLDFIWGGFGAFGAFFAGAGIASAIGALTWSRRDSHRRQLQREAMQR